MSTYKRIIFLTFLLSLPVIALAQETIPLYHWGYTYLDQLALRGYLKDLNTIQKPYYLADVEGALIKLNENVTSGSVTLSARDRWMLRYLMQEFAKPHGEKRGDMNIMVGVWADQYAQLDENETRHYTQLRSQCGLHVGEHLYFYNGGLLDQFLYNDPDYTGNKWRGFAGYLEQGYARYSNSFLNITFGRDYIYWGSGRTGRLLFSDNARPLDIFSVVLKYKAISLTTLAANLDQWTMADSLVQKYSVGTANRYLSAHRMTICLGDRFKIGLAEMLLYGGPNSTWELKYHNPLLYYHGELLNHGGYDGNGMLYLDVDWYPWSNWEFYGELLIDDFQVEETAPGDLEPNEIGYIVGLLKSGLPGLNGATLGMEYVRVANRTYNSLKDWEKFVFYNRPIGYSLGNNFDRWHVTADYWFPQRFKMSMAFDYIRKGEGSVLDQWLEPWRSYTVAQGYDEPFPFGAVETSSITTLGLSWHVTPAFLMDISYRYFEVENYSNEPGADRNNWEANVKFHWNGKHLFNY
ncbi:MAG: capsule assembly Wzi family protein [Candidatus Zhuqueibacterota bacterium]